MELTPDLAPDLLGRRATIRFREGASARDVIGRILAIGDDTVTVERRDGTVSVIDLALIVVWKVVPDRPVRSRRATSISAEELAKITSRGWPAVESVALGDWELRASAGFTGRANSALIAGDPGTGTNDAIDQVLDFYRSRGLPPIAQTVCGSAGDSLFTENGWVPSTGARPGALVQVADIRTRPPGLSEAVVSESLTDAWMNMYPRIESGHQAAARAVLAGPPTVGFVSIGDPVVAIGRVVVTGEWAGLGAVEVAPAHQRQGLATQIVTAAISWAIDRGADKAYLQTMHGNTAALALYAPFGFVDHHEYRYLVPADSRPTG